jgi:hypothetical protein
MPTQAFVNECQRVREASGALKLAARQIGAAGSAEQQAQALDILVDARRRLYDLLAKG